MYRHWVKKGLGTIMKEMLNCPLYDLAVRKVGIMFLTEERLNNKRANLNTLSHNGIVHLARNLTVGQVGQRGKRLIAFTMVEHQTYTRHL